MPLYMNIYYLVEIYPLPFCNALVTPIAIAHREVGNAEGFATYFHVISLLIEKARFFQRKI